MSIYRNGGFLGVSARLTDPITFVGGVTLGILGSTSDTPLSITGLVGGIDTRPRSGDLVIVAFATGSTASRTLLVSGYTTIANLYANDTVDVNLKVAYKLMGDTSDTSITFSSGTQSTADAGAVAVHVWRNVDFSNPFDVTYTSTTGVNSAVPNPPAITPITPGSCIVVIGASGHLAGTQYYASPEDAVVSFFTTGFDDTNDVTIGMGVYREWTAGVYDTAPFKFSATDSTSFSWAAATLALRPKHNDLGTSGIWSIDSAFLNSKRLIGA